MSESNFVIMGNVTSLLLLHLYSLNKQCIKLHNSDYN